MNCPNKSNVPVGISGRRIVYEKRAHKIQGKGIIECTKCGTKWCCWECAIECDALDHEHFDKIYENEGDAPDIFYIVCCRCSGQPASWQDRT